MKFSIIIPAYNASKFIEQSLNSVISQTFTDYEVIIVNDGSRDDTAAVTLNHINKFKDKKTKLINQENKGLGGARNTGILNSSGEYIALLDADDIWYKDKLKIVYDTLTRLKDIDVICHAELWVDKTKKSKSRVYYGPSKDCTYQRLLFKGNRLSSSATVIRRGKIMEAGLFSENRQWHGVEDYDMWLRLSKANAKFFFLNNICGEYVLHGNNMTQDIVLFNSRVLSLIEYHFRELPRRSLIYRYLFNRRKAKIYQELLLQRKQ